MNRFIILFLFSCFFLVQGQSSEVALNQNKKALAKAQNYSIILDDLNKRLDRLVSQKANMIKRVEIAGLSPVVLSSLKRSRRELENFALEKFSIPVNEKISVELKLLDLEEEIERIELHHSEWNEKKAEISELKNRLELLFEISLKGETLEKEVLEFKEFIDDRILWTSSHRALWDFSFSLSGTKLYVAFEVLKNIFLESWIYIFLTLGFRSLVVMVLLRIAKTQKSKLNFFGLFKFKILILFSGVFFYLLSNNILEYFVIDSKIRESLYPFLLTNVVALVGAIYFSKNGIFESIYPKAEDTAKRATAFFNRISWISPLLIFYTITYHDIFYTFEEFVEGVILLAFFSMISLFTVKDFFNVKKNLETYESHETFHYGKIHLIILMTVTLIPLTLVIATFVGYRESSIYLYKNWLTTLIIAMTWLSLLSVMWHFRRFLRKESIENAREVLDSGGESDIQELRDANREIGNVFQAIGIIFLALSIWYVWGETFKAVKFSDHIALWNQDKETITILDLALAILISVSGYLLHRNLRSSLDIYVFSPMGISEGNRYAIATISRYTIFFLFTAMSFRQIGLGWEKIQWLAAAFSVGLGFGMQEIFANFISGLILLTERPVRVGDVISLGDVWGQVEEINIRSTTITNWDRQEVIVPNKELITGKLTNWTLSNKLIRVIIAVGIAYDSDVSKAKEVMLEAAINNSKVANDPIPMVCLMAFEDSSMKLEMDIFISDFTSEDDLDEVKDEINTEILNAFRKEKIEIPFPQRVVHMTT